MAVAVPANRTVEADVSPNRGYSVQDILETGKLSMSQNDFAKEYGIDSALHIRLKKLLYMRYQVPDLAKAIIFLKGERNLS